MGTRPNWRSLDLSNLPPRVRAAVEMVAERNSLTAAELIAACVLVSATTEHLAAVREAVTVSASRGVGV